MSRETYYFKTKLTASALEQKYTFSEVLRSFQVLNFGDDDVIIEFDNDIDTSSIILPARGSIQIKTNMLDMHYKSVTATGATIYIYGLKQDKD